MLLSDPEVAQFVNAEFVPAWESVRPVPKVTIDFGDGRVLERTLQGNTVLYVCLPDGRVVDAFPGVHTPADFLPAVRQTLAFLRETAFSPSDEVLREWHLGQVEARRAEALRLTLTKAAIESPLLRGLGAPPAAPRPRSPLPEIGAARADPAAAYAALTARIEDVSKSALSGEAVAERFLALPPEHRPSPEELGELLVREDSRRNVELLRPAVHLFLSLSERAPRPAECRDRLFKELLQVPLDDPYLGLADVLLPGTGIRN